MFGDCSQFSIWLRSGVKAFWMEHCPGDYTWNKKQRRRVHSFGCKRAFIVAWILDPSQVRWLNVHVICLTIWLVALVWCHKISAQMLMSKLKITKFCMCIITRSFKNDTDSGAIVVSGHAFHIRAHGEKGPVEYRNLAPKFVKIERSNRAIATVLPHDLDETGLKLSCIQI